jgi:phosphotransferase system IIB component
VGSRIILHLKDYSKVNKSQLEQAGVTGFIEKSDKLTLVVKDDSERVYKAIFGEA